MIGKKGKDILKVFMNTQFEGINEKISGQ